MITLIKSLELDWWSNFSFLHKLAAERKNCAEPEGEKDKNSNFWVRVLYNRPFLFCLAFPLFQNESLETMFPLKVYFHVNKTHFYMKCFALGLVLKRRNMAYYIGGGGREAGGYWIMILFLLVLPGRTVWFGVKLAWGFLLRTEQVDEWRDFHPVVVPLTGPFQLASAVFDAYTVNVCASVVFAVRSSFPFYSEKKNRCPWSVQHQNQGCCYCWCVLGEVGWGVTMI